MKAPTTNDMGTKHEEFLAELFVGRKTRGSGNQFNNQMDGRNRRYDQPHALAWDGKSTLAKSMNISLATWDKAVEQADGEIPMLGIRFYANLQLQVVRDLVLLDAHDFAMILEAARKNHE